MTYIHITFFLGMLAGILLSKYLANPLHFALGWFIGMVAGLIFIRWYSQRG